MNSYGIEENVSYARTCVFSINYFYQYMTLVGNKVATKTNQNSEITKERMREGDRERERTKFLLMTLFLSYIQNMIYPMFLYMCTLEYYIHE